MNFIEKLYFKIDKRYIIIFLTTIVIFLPYISNRFIKGDDYICHVANIYSMISENGEINLSKIRDVMANSLGYGNGIFYPQLSYSVTALIYIIIKHLGMSLITSIKIYEFLVVFLAGIFLYKFCLKAFKNKNAALVTAQIYICSPYFIFDVFGRMAYAEILMFLFIPIVMIAINYILNRNYKKFIFYFVIGYTGMIYSHLVLTVFFTILLIVILMINIRQILNKKAILSFLISTIVVMSITSPFWIPMLEHKIGGQYVVFQDEAMVTLANLHSHRLDLNDIVNKESSSINVAIVYTSILALILAVITIWNNQNVLAQYTKIEKRFFWSIAIFTILAFIISSKLINWKNIPKIFWDIQFPWRMCTFIAFGIAFLAGFAIDTFKVEDKRIIFIIICIVCLSDINTVIGRENLIVIQNITNEEVSSIENRAMGSQKEYLTINSKNNIDYLKARNQDIIVMEGNADILILENNTPYMQFNIEIENCEQATLEIPRLFYLGYTIELKDKNNNIITINYYENENGFIEFDVNSSGKITIDYTGTLLNKIANICAIISISIFIFYFSFNKIKRNKRSNI